LNGKLCRCLQEREPKNINITFTRKQFGYETWIRIVISGMRCRPVISPCKNRLVCCYRDWKTERKHIQNYIPRIQKSILVGKNGIRSEG